MQKYLTAILCAFISGCGGVLLYEGEYEIANRGIIIDKRTNNSSFSEEDIAIIAGLAAIEAMDTKPNGPIKLVQYYLSDNLGKSKEYVFIAKLIDNTFIKIFSQNDTFLIGDCVELIEYDEGATLVVDAGNCAEYNKAHNQAINSTR